MSLLVAPCARIHVQLCSSVYQTFREFNRSVAGENWSVDVVLNYESVTAGTMAARRTFVLVEIGFCWRGGSFA